MSDEWIQLFEFISAEEHERIFGRQESFGQDEAESFKPESFENPDQKFERSFEQIDWSR